MIIEPFRNRTGKRTKFIKVFKRRLDLIDVFGVFQRETFAKIYEDGAIHWLNEDRSSQKVSTSASEL